MKSQPDFATAYGSRFTAVVRVIGFFSLILVLVPAHLTYKIFRPEDIFRMPQVFHRLLIRVLGFRIRTHGAIAAQSPTLFVANHASYLDIPVLAALIPATFVAKSEVACWPLIGWLAKLQNTVFVERRTARAGDQRDHLRDLLANGRSLLVFPEGTSTDGMRVLPFKSSLFSSVEEAMEGVTLTVQPVSIVCTAIGGLPITRGLRPFYAWYGDMTLVPHLWNVFKLGGFTIDVVFHAPVTAQTFPDRKALAQYCHQQVARGIEQCLKGRDLARPGEMLQLPVLA